jgi:hypothetical protein
MSRGPRAFKQSDITRALKAARAAGVKVRIKIAKDGMVIEMADANVEIAPDRNEWDTLLGPQDGAH